jgi:hypothetical protein
MLIRIDAKRLTDAAGLHATLGQAFGFAPGYGNNLDALVDCLTYLDDLKAGLTRVQVLPGEVAVLVVEHLPGAGKQTVAQVKALADAVAFVNWRRLQKKQAPVLTLAYEPA